MATKIKVSALVCDQGMGTLIRVYEKPDKNEVLSKLVLLDLGSETKENKYAGKGVASVVDALEEMLADEVPPAIDLIIVSHQDKDHWNLLESLQKKIKTNALVDHTTINQIKCGGFGTWDLKAYEAVKEFAKAFKKTPVELAADVTDYAKPLDKLDPSKMEVKLLCSGVTSSRKGAKKSKTMVPPKKASSRKKNTASAVVVIHFGGCTTIIPGDATATTIKWINENVFKKLKANPISPCRVLGVPHHGSLATIATQGKSKKRKRKPSDKDVDIGKAGNEFAAFVSAENVVASAGYKSHFQHPSKSVMMQLGFNAMKEHDKHSWVWNLDVADQWAVEPDKDIYSVKQRGIWTTIKTLLGEDKDNTYEPNFIITSAGKVFFEWGQVQKTPPYERRDRYAARPHKR